MLTDIYSDTFERDTNDPINISQSLGLGHRSKDIIDSTKTHNLSASKKSRLEKGRKSPTLNGDDLMVCREASDEQEELDEEETPRESQTPLSRTDNEDKDGLADRTGKDMADTLIYS